MKAVLLSDKGWSYRDIAEALFLDGETISKHLDEYCREKNFRSLDNCTKLLDDLIYVIDKAHS
ncbi:hypothetical protein FACS189472_06220 [Alphaproteobacteria bacterium]|nr:hypothetical protein FACS189472_06220 [Alphaproteobacteria bacterium]